MMNFITSYIRRQFPECLQMDTQQAADEVMNTQSALVIDCRRPDEYEVSRIPGAVNLHFKCSDEELKSALGSAQNDATKVICYCSLGYRSCVLAKRILANYDEFKIKPDLVYNLEGSIFKWANEDKPLVDHEGKPTKYVHPFNYKFGILGLQYSKWKWSASSDA